MKFKDKFNRFVIRHWLRVSGSVALLCVLCLYGCGQYLAYKKHHQRLISIPSLTTKEAVENWVAEGKDLVNVDLSGADLAGVRLTGVRLDGVDLSWAKLAGAQLSGASLVGAELVGVDLQEANLKGANLTGANLHGAKLNKANLIEARMQRVDLGVANLSEALLTRANLADSLLDGARFIDANLRNSTMADSSVLWTDFYHADVNYASFERVKGFTCLQLQWSKHWVDTYRDKAFACTAPILTRKSN